MRKHRVAALGLVSVMGAASCGPASGHAVATPSACGNQDRAEDFARSHADLSKAVRVLSATCATFGEVGHGSTALPPDTPVWSILVSGDFGAGSCGGPPIPPRTFAPCPTAEATTEKLVIDKNGTHRILAIVPGDG